MSYAVLQEIARATRLREGPEGVRRVLCLVHRTGRIDLKTLARRAHLPLLPGPQDHPYCRTRCHPLPVGRLRTAPTRR